MNKGNNMRTIREILIKNSMNNIRSEFEKLENMLLSVDVDLLNNAMDLYNSKNDNTDKTATVKSTVFDARMLDIASNIIDIDRRLDDIEKRQVDCCNQRKCSKDCEPSQFWFNSDNATLNEVVMLDGCDGNQQHQLSPLKQDEKKEKEPDELIIESVVKIVAETSVEPAIEIDSEPDCVTTEVEEELTELVYNEITYYKDSNNDVYSIDDNGEVNQESVGFWNADKCTIKFSKSA